MRKYISIIMLSVLITTVLPVPTLFAAGCTIGAANTVAGLGTQVTLKSCLPNKSYTLIMDPPAGAAYSQSIVTNEQGDAATLIPGKSATVAGEYHVRIDDATASFSVAPDAISDNASTLTASVRSIDVGGTVTVTAILRDKYDNPIAQRPVIALLSNRPDDRVEAQAQQSDVLGRMTWVVTAVTAGTMNLTAYDILRAKALSTRVDIRVGNPSTLSASLTGNEFGGTLPIDHFDILLDTQGSVKANELFTVTIVARDRANDVVEDYTKAVTITSSDAEAEFPRKGSDPSRPSEGEVAFREVDLGRRKIPLGFLMRSGGNQTITVHEVGNTSIQGSLAVVVDQSDGGPSAGKIIILDPKDRSTIGTTTVHLQGNAPSLVNLKVKGGSGTVNGESDAEGVFRIDVPLPPGDKEATLIVSSENGTYESDPVHFFIDQEVPVILGASISPEAGYTETDAVLTMRCEPGLTSAIATVDGTAIPLLESPTLPGTYTGTFTTGKEEKTYIFTFQATDVVGNVSVPLQIQWSVHKRKPGKVMNLQAEGRPQGVTLAWQPPEGSMAISEYKIYIAAKDEPDNILYSVSTKKNVTSARINDLDIGKMYAFTMTAVNAEHEESEERSDPAFAQPQGLRLTATSGNGKVFLEWTAPSSLPLNRYILRFGTSPDDYTETRTINASLQSEDVTDLINGVTYEFRLTPVDLTGKVLDELSAVVHATPGGEGFHAAGSDPVPPNLITKTEDKHSGADLSPPPVYINTSNSGLPMPILGLIAGLTVLMGLFWRHYLRQRRMAHEFLMMMEKKYKN